MCTTFQNENINTFYYYIPSKCSFSVHVQFQYQNFQIKIRLLISEFQNVIGELRVYDHNTGYMTTTTMNCNRTSFSDRYAPRSETGERSFVKLHRGTGSLHHVRAENIVPYSNRRCADS